MVNLNIRLRVPGELDRIATLPINEDPSWRKDWSRFVNPNSIPLLGVHNFSHYVASGIFECELSINNGVVPFAGKLYFTDIIATLDDPNYEIRPLPYPGSNTIRDKWIVANSPTTPGKVNVFLPRWYLKRRYIICKKDAAKRDTDAVLQYASLKIPSVVTNYGPYLMTQPIVDRNAEQFRCTQNNGAILKALTGGTPVYISNICDGSAGSFASWFPNGQSVAGAPAGFGIHPYTGYEQCSASIFMHRMLYGMTWDRMPIACYHEDGSLFRLEDYPTFASSVPQLMRGEPTKQGITESVLFLDGDYTNYHYRIYNPNYAGLCQYETGLWNYYAHDVAHLRRASFDGEPVVEYTNNPMIIEDMDCVTEYIRLNGWGNRNDSKVVQQYPGDYIPLTLKSLLKYANTNPHQGINVDRAYGWAMYHFALMAKWIPDNRTAATWMQQAILLYNTSVDQHGIVQRQWHPPYLPDNVEGIQSFHVALITLGICVASRAVQDQTVAPLLLTLCDNLYNKLGTKSYEYAPSEQGPPHWLWTYENGVIIDPLDVNKGDPNGDPTHVLAALTEIARLSSSDVPIRTSLKQWYPAATIDERKSQLASVLWPDKQQTAGMQSYLS